MILNMQPELSALPFATLPPLSLDKFMEQSGLSPTTCWRFRKCGWLRTVQIGTRHYVPREAIAEFNERAARGDFAAPLPNPSIHRKTAKKGLAI